MTGVSIEARSDGLEALNKALDRMRLLGQRPRSIWEAIGNYGENSTRLRFNNQVGPDGQKWKPSKRVAKGGGQTLVLKARLLRSISHKANNEGAEWGSNVVYAGIHQFGGDINRLAFSGWAKLRTDAGGRLMRQGKEGKLSQLARFAKGSGKRFKTVRYTVDAHKITMPARPYLGVNAADGREMLRLSEEAVDIAAKNRGGAA